MATNKQAPFQDVISTSGIIFDSTDTTTKKILVTAGTDGTLIDNISATSDDTVDIIAVLTLNDATTDFQIGEVTIPAGSGTDGTLPSVNLLDSTKLPFLQARGGLPLETLWTLKINAKVTMTAAKTLAIVAYGGDY